MDYIHNSESFLKDFDMRRPNLRLLFHFMNDFVPSLHKLKVATLKHPVYHILGSTWARFIMQRPLQNYVDIRRPKLV